LELRAAGDNVFEALNALADRAYEPPPAAAPQNSRCPAGFAPTCVADLPTLPLRIFALANTFGGAGDAAAFLCAVGQHPAQTSGSGAVLTDLRLSEVSAETYLAVPPTVMHLCINDAHLTETQVAAILDSARHPRLKTLCLHSCAEVFPWEVLHRNAPLEPAFARSPLREVAHPTLRTLELICFDVDVKRAAIREAWVLAMLGPSQADCEEAHQVRVRFPRLRHVVANGVAVGGWPTHDMFVPPPAAAHPPGALQRIFAATTAFLGRLWLRPNGESNI
jgi:hypothetical protein